MSDVEEAARAICKALRRNPDAELVGGYEGPRLRQWEGYIVEATAALTEARKQGATEERERLAKLGVGLDVYRDTRGNIARREPPKSEHIAELPDWLLDSAGRSESEATQTDVDRWRPIETAPCNDTEALVYWGNPDFPMCGRQTVEDLDHDSDPLWWKERGATHWKPLGPTPEEEDQCAN